MIYSVTEWYDSSSSHYYFDASKVDPNKPFEAAFLALLKRAAQDPHKWIDISQDDKTLTKINDRFGKYQNTMDCWEKLLVRPPCSVDDDVTITVCG